MITNPLCAQHWRLSLLVWERQLVQIDMVGYPGMPALERRMHQTTQWPPPRPAASLGLGAPALALPAPAFVLAGRVWTRAAVPPQSKGDPKSIYGGCDSWRGSGEIQAERKRVSVCTKHPWPKSNWLQPWFLTSTAVSLLTWSDFNSTYPSDQTFWTANENVVGTCTRSVSM